MKKGEVEFYSVKYSNPSSIRSKAIVPKKGRCNPILDHFPDFHVKITKAETRNWQTQFSNAAAFADSSIPREELPQVLSELDHTYAAIATETQHKGFPLKPSCIFTLESLKNITMCLPVARFPLNVFALEFVKTKDDFNKLDKELLEEEYKSRLELCAITCVLSAFHAFCALFKVATAPSPLEAICYSLFVGIRPFLDFSWTHSFIRFAKSRSALRRAAFAQPFHGLATKLITSNPFSESLFCPVALQEVKTSLNAQNLALEDILNLTPKAAAIHLKQRHIFLQALSHKTKPPYMGRKGPSYMFKGSQKRGSKHQSQSNTSSPNYRGHTRGNRGPRFHRRRGRRGRQ